MKRFSIVILGTVISLMAPIAPAHAQTQTQRVTAQAFMNALTTKDWDRLTGLLDPEFLQKWDIPKWKRVMESVEARGGSVRNHRLMTCEMNRMYANMVFRVRLERDSVDFRIVVDTVNLVDAFWLEPIAPSYKFALPSYVNRKKFKEIPVTVGDSLGVPGALCMPVRARKAPAVLIVSGSGTQDRDGTYLGNKPCRDIAYGLASRGFVVLRFDKRSFARPASIDPARTTVESEVLGDARAALALLRTRPEIDPRRIFLLGHDLGGVLIPIIANEDGGVRGLVVLAAPGRRVEEVALDQLGRSLAAAKTLTPAQKQMFDEQLETGRKIVAGQAPPTAVFYSLPASYFYDLADRNIRGEVRNLKVPVFAGFGLNDDMITARDRIVWRELLANNPGHVVREFEECNHLLIPTKTTGPASFRVEGNVAKSVIDAIIAWCDGLDS